MLLRLIYISISALLLFFLNTNLYAQVEAIDSIDSQLGKGRSQEERINIRNRLAAEYMKTDRERALDLIEQVISEAENSNLRVELALAYRYKGEIHNGIGKYTDAIKSYMEAIAIYNSLDMLYEMGYCYYRLSMVYKNIGEYSKSMEYGVEGLRIFEKIEREDGIALIFRLLGSLYKYQGDLEKSLDYYLRGLSINQKIADRQGIANSYNNIGVVYFIEGDYESALDYYKRSLAINLENQNLIESAINYGNIGHTFLEWGIMDSALFYIDKKHEYSLKLNARRYIATSLELYGSYYMKLGDHSKAIGYFYDALGIFRNIGTLENTRSILQKLSELYLGQGDFENAHNTYKAYTAIKDSLMNNEVIHRIRQLEMEYSFEKEREITTLLEERRKLRVFIAISILILSTLILFLLFMNQRIKLRQRNLMHRNLEMEKQQLKHEVAYKNKELTSKAIFMAEKNVMLDEITNRLNKLLNHPGDRSRAIREIIADLKMHSNKKIWEEFEVVFVQAHPDFIDKISRMFPDLTPNEKRLSALLRLNFSTKDISNITHQSYHSITVARTRLRKKLGISNTGENLVTYLARL